MNRRGFLTGLASLVCAAPAIVSAASIMPVKAIRLPEPDNVEAILDLLSRRIDAAHAAMHRAMCEALYSDRNGIADAPYVRPYAYEVLPPQIPKYERKELGSFAMRFPAPRRIELING